MFDTNSHLAPLWVGHGVWGDGGAGIWWGAIYVRVKISNFEGMKHISKLKNKTKKVCPPPNPPL